jgi:hypothetical protein
MMCPYCETPRRRRRRRREPSPDEEVRHDTQRTSIGIILLAVLGAIGLAIYLTAGGAALAQGEPSPLLGALLGILVLGLLSTGIMFLRTLGHPEQRSFGRVVVGTLAISGGCFLAWLLMVVAVVILLFAVCHIKG